MTSLAQLRSICRNNHFPMPAEALQLPSPEMLPANERRRASQVVRLTQACIQQVLKDCPFPVESLRSVFATDEGTGEICQQVLQAVSTTRQVSPLVFSNSVQNAPSGYFSISWRNRQSSTVVSLGLESFASGLLCAVTEAITCEQPILLVAYDPAILSFVNVNWGSGLDVFGLGSLRTVNASPGLVNLFDLSLDTAARSTHFSPQISCLHRCNSPGLTRARQASP